MTNAEMDAIQVHDTPMPLQRTLTPSLKLLRECLVEPTDGTGTGSHSHQRLGHFSHLMRTCPGHEHLAEPLGHLRFIAAIALKDLRVELTLAISGHLQLLNASRRCEKARGCRSRCDSPCCCRLLSPHPTPMSASSSSRITLSNTTRMALRASSRRYCWNSCCVGSVGADCF